MAKCPNCQKVKEENIKPGSLTQIIEVPELKYETINMYFLVGLPKHRTPHNFIWVIVDRIIKSAHFFPVKSTRIMLESTLMRL